MSRKWEASKKRDDAVFPPWAWPAKKLLRAFSSIPLAVGLLAFVGLYAVLASVPIGLLAEIPTHLLVASTLLVPLAGIGIVVRVGLRRVLGGTERGVRFVVGFGVLAVLWGSVVWGWSGAVYPLMRYDPGTGEGLMLFSGFVHTYAATTLRRLPAFEMTELEFYAWWPLRLVLLAFVLNLVTATVRRIEFKFVNIGVLSVHTGIVMIAMGSVYYSSRKLEGDVLLPAGSVNPATGQPAPGPIVTSFFDNTSMALWLDQGRGLEQRPLTGVPRYNDYMAVEMEPTVRAAIGQIDPPGPRDRRLDMRVPGSSRPGERTDADIRYRVVGYASYAETLTDWARVDLSRLKGLPSDFALNPLRVIELVNTESEGPAVLDGPVPFFFLPNSPAHRAWVSEHLTIEYTLGMDAGRWSDLSVKLPDGASHALIVDVPGSGEGEGEAFHAVYAIAGTEAIAVGSTGYTIRVQEILPEPPLPIITPGYEGATSGVAIVEVTPPGGQRYQRWVYQRFPELNQDLPTDPAPGMPARRAADPGIRIAYVDATAVQMYLDERSDGSVRAIVRGPNGAVRVVEGLKRGDRVALVDRLDVRLGERWPHAEQVQRPIVVPPAERAPSAIGTHENAMLAVEVSVAGTAGTPGTAWSRVVWVGFTQYATLQPPRTSVSLPDGRTVKIGFGRLAHRFPGFGVQLIDFRIEQYDHRGAPRDYRSVLRVVPSDGRAAPYQHEASLNAPLTAPYHWSEQRSTPVNAAARLLAGLNPNQFKLSQAGWDQQGWTQTQAQTDQGLMKRPVAGFTILGVGNSPGIHIIAMGGLFMACGIPWAFYVKPAIQRQRKRTIQRQLAAGTYAPPPPPPVREPEPVGVST